MHLKRPPLPLEKRAIRINKRSLCPDDDPLPKGYNDNGASFVDEGFVMRKVLEAVLADADGKVCSPAERRIPQLVDRAPLLDVYTLGS